MDRGGVRGECCTEDLFPKHSEEYKLMKSINAAAIG